MITDVEEETQDLDWLSVDKNGELAHFSSGGRGFLPPSVKASRANVDRLAVFFREYLSPNGSAIESPNLPSHIQFESEAQRSRYLTHFLQKGAKGLYSFDCVIGPRRPSNYFLVAIPSSPMRVDGLPDEIRQILNMTRFEGRFSSVDEVQQEEFS